MYPNKLLSKSFTNLETKLCNTPNYKLIISAGTPYEAGIFKVKLVLQRDFPASPPKGRFE